MNKIPVTVVTGFLGAGKTTFINQLLKVFDSTQFALVENEFGEVALDTQLIKGIETEQLFELKQGCICCTISDEYELVLQELAERFTNVEHLLIETTGVADPAAVIQPFFRDENLQKLYEYKGTICLLDALNYKSQAEEELRLKQLAVADLILVNKSAELTTNKRDTIRKELELLNPFSKIDFVDYGNVSNLQLYAIQTKRRSAFDFISLNHSHTHIQSHLLRFEKPINKTEFLRWLAYTLDIYKNQIYRCKGVVCFNGEPFEYIIQGVGGSFELVEGDMILDSYQSQVVFIGNLDGVSLEF